MSEDANISLNISMPAKDWKVVQAFVVDCVGDWGDSSSDTRAVERLGRRIAVALKGIKS